MKYPIWGAVLCALLPSVVGANGHGLTIYEYFGYEDPNLFENYTAKYDRSPSYHFYRNEDVAFDRVNEGLQADMVHICAGSLGKWVDAGLLEPWDFSRIDVESFTEFDNMQSDRMRDLMSYFVPFEYGTTLLTYNTQQVPKSDIQSLNVFRDPAYLGRVSVPSDPDDLIALAFLATGVSNWENPSEDEITEAISWLEDVDANVQSYWDDEDELVELLVSGDVLVSWAWNGIKLYTEMYTQFVGHQLSPVEGSTIWTCGYVKLKGSGTFDEQAYDYVNALLAEETVGPLLDWGIGHMNKAALAAQTTPEQLGKLGLILPDGPVLMQSPMASSVRDRLLSEIAHLGNRS